MPAMTETTTRLFAQQLGALSNILGKLASHCEAKKIEPAGYLHARLIADMFPFTRQVQIACDFAKGAVSRIAGVENPVFADDETTIEALKSRIQRTLDHVASIPASAIDGTEAKVIRIKLGRNAPETEMTCGDYVTKVVLPNFFFHVTAAYAILRANGVDVGKNDFLGRS